MTTNKPLVTVAIPFYNTERWLPFAIQSVVNQTFRDWELLLIDDGSTDGSLAVTRRFAERDSRIRVVSDGENHHLASRLNESVLMARGELYARMDSDDIMVADRLERQVAYLQAHPDVDVMGSSAMRIDSENHICGSIDMAGNIYSFIHPTIMARTEWFRANPYNEQMKKGQDAELWMRTRHRYTFFNSPEPMLFYRDEGLPTRKKYAASMKASRQVARNYKAYGKSKGWAVRRCIRTWIKQWTYDLFGLIDQTDFLIKHRNVKPVAQSLCLDGQDLRRSVSDNNDE